MIDEPVADLGEVPAAHTLILGPDSFILMDTKFPENGWSTIELLTLYKNDGSATARRHISHLKFKS